MYSDTNTIIRPRYSGPVFQIEDGTRYGNRKAWGGSQLTNIQIDPATPGLTAINLVGGNGSEVRNITSSRGAYPLEYGIRVVDGRDHDGQYSTFDRIRFTDVKHGVEWLKNCPDCVITNSMFYGQNIRGSTGLKARGRNLTVYESHFQFYDRGIDVDTKEFELYGGSWENNHGANPWAEYAVRIGPAAEEVTFRSLSIANLSSIINKRVFDLSPEAKRYTFEYLSGHVGPSDVPVGFEHHFVWHNDIAPGDD
jgi:hypothetical protein